LKDVSFEVKRGEVVGIIGRNGAGKSTLLKILSRITEPTEGRVTLRGRVASLLEVGTGFHPELTGRENIFLNGAILGMTKAEIKKKFDEIVAFAEVERFLDTPVKRYSSGMYVRLAFAVAAHLEPEILVVDEVLAVGDAGFQSKCLQKMQDVSSRGGRTVLFVSHQLGSVQKLCRRAVLLQRGMIRKDGPTNEVIDEYLNSGAQAERLARWVPEEAPQSPQIRLREIRIEDAAGSTESTLSTASEIRVAIEYEIREPIRNLRIVVNLLNAEGTMLFSVSDFWHQEGERLRTPGVHRSLCRIPGHFLNVGRYYASIDAEVPQIAAHFQEAVVSFVVEELAINHLGFTYASKPAGLLHPKLDWKMERLDR
jgi:lipopolysaccharide transport system ATP-binding protein